MRSLWPRHRRFLLALAAGLAAALAAAGLGLLGSDLMLVGADTGFATYLASTLHHARRLDAAALCQRAETEDETIGFITLLALLVLAASLLAVFLTLNGPRDGALWRPALALAAVPLGWLVLHTIAAFHYAHLWYGRGPEARGLAFPGDAAPEIGDFLYFAFVLGMAAQVSDVAVTRPAMRRVVLAHSVLAFFYNTVLVALAVNAAVALSG